MNDLIAACTKGNLDVVRKLVTEKSLDPSQKDQVTGMSPFHYASQHGHVDWGEPERAPHRRVCCKFSVYIYIYFYRTSCRKSLPARILRVLASCVISKLSSLPARALISLHDVAETV